MRGRDELPAEAPQQRRWKRSGRIRSVERSKEGRISSAAEKATDSLKEREIESDGANRHNPELSRKSRSTSQVLETCSFHCSPKPELPKGLPQKRGFPETRFDQHESSRLERERQRHGRRSTSRTQINQVQAGRQVFRRRDRFEQETVDGFIWICQRREVDLPVPVRQDLVKDSELYRERFRDLDPGMLGAIGQDVRDVAKTHPRAPDETCAAMRATAAAVMPGMRSA